MQSQYRMHPALVVFLCMGLFVQDVSSVFLVGQRSLSNTIVIKSVMLTKKGLVLGAAILAPVLANSAVKTGLGVASAAPIALAGLAGKPFVVGPVVVGILLLKAGIGFLVLKKGVLILKRKVFDKNVAVAKIIIGNVVSAKTSVLLGKKKLLALKAAAVGAATASVVKKVVSGSRAIGSGAMNTARAVFKLGKSALPTEVVESPQEPNNYTSTQSNVTSYAYLNQPMPVQTNQIISSIMNTRLPILNYLSQGLNAARPPSSGSLSLPLPFAPESLNIPSPLSPEGLVAPLSLVPESLPGVLSEQLPSPMFVPDFNLIGPLGPAPMLPLALPA